LPGDIINSDKMKSLILVLFAAALSFTSSAQRSGTVSLPVSAVSVSATPAQRHVSADAILQIINLNERNVPIIIQYYNDEETNALAVELSNELKRNKQVVHSMLPIAAAAAEVKRKHNFVYQQTDSTFQITVNPRP
jgi:hypothetical protein